MKRIGAWRTACLALLYTVFAAAIWYMLRKDAFMGPDGQLSVLFLVISAVAALGLTAFAFILLFPASRSGITGRQRISALVFLLIHSLLLAGLWWLEAAGQIRKAAGEADVVKLTLAIIAVLAVDAVGLLLLFPAKPDDADDAKTGKKEQPEKKTYQPPVPMKIPTVFQEEKKTGGSGDEKAQPSNQEETAPSSKSPFDRMSALDQALSIHSSTSKKQPDAETSAGKPTLEKNDRSVSEQPETDGTMLDALWSGKAIPVASSREDGTIMDTPIRGSETVYETSSRGNETVLDAPSRGNETVLDVPSRGNETVLDVPSRGNETVLDVPSRGNETVFDPLVQSSETVMESVQDTGKNDQPGVQWERRSKSQVRTPAAGGSVLPDITQFQQQEQPARSRERQVSTSGLLVYQDGDMKLRISLKEGETRLGSKSAKVDYVLQNPHISRLHAVFTQRGNEFFVRDMHSTNGTFLNGSETRIPSEVNVQIHSGDSITLADQTFRFYVGEEPDRQE